MNLELKITDENIKECLIKTFNDELGGIHYIFRFPNNYGASVIKGRYSYGGDKDLWEMALLYFQDATNAYELVYEKDFVIDVKGYLTDEQVSELLGKITNYDVNNEEHEESEPEGTKGENTMLKEITLSNGKVVRVLEAGGYDDGYYWDMSATVEIDGDEYTIQDAGSGSGYVPFFKSMSKNGPCKLTGVELTPVNEDDGDWGYIFGAIENIAESFFDNNAKESYEYSDDTYGNYSTHIDGVKVDMDEEEDE